MEQQPLLVLPAQPPSNCTEPNSAAPISGTRPHLLDQQIRTRTPSSSATSWVPGSTGLYPRPTSAQRQGEFPTNFPIWHWREKGTGCQESMFQAADRVEHSHPPGPDARSSSLPLVQTMYIAADVWVPQKETDRKLGKIFGAFRDPVSFVR